MTLDPRSLAQLRPQMVALTRAYAAGDVSQFIDALQALSAASKTDTSSSKLENVSILGPQLRQLTVDARAALEKLIYEARLDTLTDREEPWERRRVDLVERSGALADHATRESAALSVLWRELSERDQNLFNSQETIQRIQRFLNRTRSDADALRTSLYEVLMAQGYQDIAGNIERSVMRLVIDLETVQCELVRRAGLAFARVGDPESASARDDTDARLPGVASSSQ
jgi:chemotaxis protein CheZ